MARAESQRRLDLDADVIAAQPVSVMRAMHQHAPGADRLQPRQRARDPVPLGDLAKTPRALAASASAAASISARTPASSGGSPKKTSTAQTRPVRLLEGAGRCFGGVECFDNDVHDGAGAPFVADETQHMAGVIGGQTFEHVGRLARRAGGVTFPPERRACILTAEARQAPGSVGPDDREADDLSRGTKEGRQIVLARLARRLRRATRLRLSRSAAPDAAGDQPRGGDGRAAAAAPQNIFEGPNGDYEKLRRDFVEGGVATDTLDTYEYYFRLTLNGVAPPAVIERAPWLLEIVDAAGEIAVPPEGARVAILNDVKDKFAGQMLGAQAIVFVLPMVRLEDSGWIATLARLIDRLAQSKDKKLRRLVVAFSQYERLFIGLGPSAFTYACDPAVALYVRAQIPARRALDGRPARAGARRRLDTLHGDVGLWLRQALPEPQYRPASARRTAFPPPGPRRGARL